MRRTACFSLLFLAVFGGGAARAADWPDRAPRAAPPPLVVKDRAFAGRCCRGPVPTNSPLDPTYVGSGYGLGKPSYYGNRPPLGFEAY